MTVSVHSRYLDVPRCRTMKFAWLFVPACVQLWNCLDEPCFAGDGAAAFNSRINRALLLDGFVFPSSMISYDFLSSGCQ